MNSCKVLDENDIQIISNHYPPKTFRASEILYEGQIPNICFLIIEGHVELYYRRKHKDSVKEKQIVGLKEILNCDQFKYTVKITDEAKISILDRSSLYEHLGKSFDSEQDEIGKIISKLI